MPEDCPCEGTDLLRVLTLNVWGLPWPLSRDRTRRFQRLVRHFGEHCYDVAGLQEVWGAKGRPALPRLAVPESPRDSGLALAGRLAARALPTVSHFAHATGVDRMVGKGLLLASVGALTVGVTHLQAGRVHDGTRARQVTELVGRLDDVPGPIVLMGDFNFSRDSAHDEASARRLQDAGLVDTVATHQPTYVRRNPYTTSRSAGERFDRILVRNGGGVALEPVTVETVPRVFSDHQPLLATLRVRRTS